MKKQHNLGKRTTLFFVFIILINIALAAQTEMDDNYKVSSVVGSGITTDYDDIRISSVAGETGIGNYSDIRYLIENGILYVLNIAEDTSSPIISNLRNTLTTNESSFIEWDCSEPCNYSISWYGSNGLVGSVYSDTFAISHNPYLGSLLNSTTYFINLTVWDYSGNFIIDNSFSFTTAENIIDITPPIITASNPSGTITSSTTSLKVTTDENATCRYTEGNISTDYAGMPYNFSGNNLQHTKTITLANGYYEFYARCIDNLGNVMAQSENISFTIDVAVTTPPAPSGGGGGGGSISYTAQIQPNFMVDTDLLMVSIQQGESQSRIIRIANIGTTDLEVVYIELGELENFMVIDEQSFSLAPGEIKKIKLEIFATEKQPPDSYTGSIVIKSGSITKKINAVIEIKGKTPLFDITTKVIEKELRPGDEVRATMSILNLGDLEHIDILLHYAIQDFDGNVFTFKEESLAIDRKIEITSTLEIPKDIPDDYYVFYSKISYGNIVASSIDTFEVARGIELLGPVYSRLLTIIIILLMIALLIFLLLRFMRKRGVDIRWEIKELYRIIWPAKYKIKTYGHIETPKYPKAKPLLPSKAKPSLPFKTRLMLPFKAAPLLPISVILILLVVSAFSLTRLLQPVGLAPGKLISLEESYIDEVNLTVNESGEYIWAMGNPGSLKSIKFDGRIDKNAYAGIYLVHNNKRYLIFDSSRLSKDSIDENIINFENICIDTCLLPGFNKTPYNLMFFVEDGSLSIDNVKYNIEKEVKG